MKTQKIFLLALVLLLALGLASCGDAEKSTAPDCFVFEEYGSFDDVAELKGKVIGDNADYNLIALENVTLDDIGNSVRKVEVIDIADGNRVLFEDTVITSPGQTSKATEYDISQYPLISVKSYSYRGTGEDGEPLFDSSKTCYLISKTGTAASLGSAMKEGEDSVDVASLQNIYLAKFGDYMYWINRDLEVMRTVLLDVSLSYDQWSFDQFAAEYNGYLYTYAYSTQTMVATVIVYAPNGVACAQYNFSSILGESSINGSSAIDPKVFVLNNGNVLIQECIVVEDDGEYDFVYGYAKQKIDLVTKVMDYTNGAVTELDFDYVVKNLESAYERVGNTWGDFAFKLADGYDNQAYLVPVADGALGRVTEYVVLDNALERKYTLNNKHLANYSAYGSGYDMIGYADDDGYVAMAFINGNEGFYRFDWDGNIVFTYPTNFYMGSFTPTHYVTESGIYANGGSLVFDIEAFGGEVDYATMNVVFVTKDGEAENVRNSSGDIIGETRAKLVYKVDVLTGKAELIVDSSEDQDYDLLSVDGAYMVEDYKKNTISLYNKSGKVVLIAAFDDFEGGEPDVAHMEDSVYVSVCVGGEYKTYVMDMGAMMGGS